MIYKLKNVTTGEEKTLEDWGIDDESVTLRVENLATDYLTFSTQELFDGTPQFANGAILQFTRSEDDGSDVEQLFYGRVDKIKRTGTGESEALSYVVAGPWHWMERTIYVSVWRIFANPLDESEGLIDFENSHLVLLLKQDTTKARTAEQILALVNYAISAGAPMQYDATGCPDIDMPLDEVRDMSPAECVRRLLKLVPNVTSWFDYSTTPPTLHIKQRTALTERNITADDIDEVELDERHDLVASGVIITYEKTHRLNGAENVVLDRRAYPPGASAKDLNPIAASVALEGSTVNEVTATFETEPVPAGSAALTAWWQQREQTIGQANVSGLSLSATSRTVENPSEYPYIVKSGLVPAWASETAEDKWTTNASYSVTDGAGTALETIRDEPLRQAVTVSKKAGGTYRSTVEFVSEEATPVGLEEAIYNAMSQLHYDGRIIVSRENGEVDTSYTLGQVINITGMRAEWTTMKAQIQNIVHNWTTGQTIITVGPPKHLGVDDIIEILRLTRFRMRWTASGTLTSGRASGGAVELSGKSEKDNTQRGRGELDKLTLGRLITLDVAAVSGKTIAFRELPYCDNGVLKKVLVLASAPY
jgi:hypothetical protein